MGDWDWIVAWLESGLLLSTSTQQADRWDDELNQKLRQSTSNLCFFQYHHESQVDTNTLDEAIY
jgi:hypothetical protein